MKKAPLYIILITLFLWSCGGPETPKDTAVQNSEKPKTEVPSFNADSAYSFVGKQLSFGPRVPNSKAHAQCAQYLTDKMKQYSSHVQVQEGEVFAYNKTRLKFKNIIASWKPETKNRVLLCAHWDSRPWADHDPDPKNRKKPVEGANDGASGVGILLEVARQLSLKEPAIGIDIVLFDAEDHGPHQEEGAGNAEEHWALGSYYWSRNPHVADYTARFGILLDMVGAANATFLMEGISMEYAADIVKKVWTTANRIGFSSYFLFEQGGYITDDHVPINRIRNIPTIDIIHLDRSTSSGFYPYWHTTGDTFDKIDPYTLKVVGQTVLTVIYEEN